MPATPTYVALAEVTLATNTSSVTFPVPSGYRDLILVIDGTATTANGLGMRFNGDSGSNYTFVQMYGTGSSTGSLSGSANYGRIEATYTTRTIKKIQIMDVSATDKHKTWLVRSDWADGEVDAIAGRWANTAAITSIEIYIASYAFTTGHTFNLYGIEA